MENKSYTYMELWNSSFVFEKLYSECIKNNKSTDSNPCDKYKKKYEISRDAYTNCLINNNKEDHAIQCVQFKKNYEKYAGLSFKIFRESTFKNDSLEESSR